jgi:hypothetical protein
MHFIFLIFFPLFSWAGAWGGSGGGEFFRDQHNPWWVKNVTEVHYCLELDPEGFSASPEKAKDLAAKAIEYWQDEFRDRGELLGVGTQKFILTHNFPGEGCRGHEDLRIQFGYGTLTEEQRKTFADHSEDPQNYVGIAVRTEYDKEALRGKGFIFIASDKGSYPYNRGQGVSRNLWSHDGLLFRILQHELGHVFGIAHTDTGFMAADFPESMVRNYQLYRMVESKPFFVPPQTFRTCALSGEISEESLKCLMVKGLNDWKDLEILGLERGGKAVTLGKARNVKRTSSRNRFPLKLFLPQEQKVFSPLPGELIWRGPAQQQFKLIAELEETDGKKTPLLLELSPEEIEVYRFNGTEIEKWF